MCIRDRAPLGAPSRRLTGAGPRFLTNRFVLPLSLIHISEPTRLLSISYAVFCLKKKRRPPRSTLSSSSAASDVYKRQGASRRSIAASYRRRAALSDQPFRLASVSYTHLRAHETPEHLVCRLLLEKK